MTIRLGLLSTARINDAIVGGATGLDDLAVTAVASRSLEAAEAYARERGIERRHGSYEALLDDGDVDAVYVSLPNSMHHEWTLRALAAGKHVLCEKPYSRRPEQVEEAYAAAESGGLVLMEAFMYRHHPQAATLAELVTGGAIGTLRLVRSEFSFTLADPGNIRARPELAGGALMDIGCYCVNGSRLLAGEPRSVLASQVNGPTGVDMTFCGIMRCDDDVLAQFHTSFALPPSQRLEALGTEGTIVLKAPWRPDLGGRMLLRRGSTEEEVEVPEADAYRLQLANLAAAIAGKAPPLLGRHDALGQAAAIDALYRSASEEAAVGL